jgi:glucose-6-phosphate dehydrogenase assembly protein OpcA
MAVNEAVWSAQGTTPDAIESALRELLVERHAESDSYVPARVLNMIAFVDLEWMGEIANRLRGVGRYSASRLVVLAYEPGRQRLDARVMISSEREPTPGELALLHETVVVELGDRHLGDLITIADPLVVTDMPTLLWSPHGHHDIASPLLGLSQSVLVDSVDEPDAADAVQRAGNLSEQVYVVDLAWLRTTPWRERVAAWFDPPGKRLELAHLSSVTVRHHHESTVAAMLFVGWLSSRLGWQPSAWAGDGAALRGSAHTSRQDVALHLEAAPDLMVRGLEDVTLETAEGQSVTLARNRGGLRARARSADGREREWTIPGASRGEGGVLGEGIRQALLRDPTYLPALDAARAMLA